MKSAFEIETSCSKCLGQGKINSKNCDVCKGTGTVLTETGAKLIRILRDSIRTSEH